MRNIIFFAFLLVVTALTGQNNSYYYNGEKHSLKVIPHYLYITVSNKLDDFKSTLETEPVDIITSDELLKCIIIDTRNVSVYNRLWELCMADSRVETISPVYGDAEQNHLITCDSRVAVRLKDGTTKSELDKILDKFGCHIYSRSDQDTMFFVLHTSQRNGASAIEVANLMYESKLFFVVSPDFRISGRMCETLANDPMYYEQWNIPSTKTNLAWDITKGHGSIVIAQLDLGVQLDHHDLIENLVPGYNASWSDAPPGSHRGHHHGTKCAGVAVAKQNNHIGISGIAPNCKLMPIYFGMRASEVYNAFQYAIRNGASIISMSWILHTFDDVTDLAISNAITQGRGGKGCVMVAASGAIPDDVGQNLFPRNKKEVIVVGSSLPNGMRAGSYTYYAEECPSDYGDWMSIMAPGHEVPTTTIGNDYEMGNCTSIATPQVAAVAALMLSVNPDLTAEQVRYILESTAQKTGGYNYATHPDHPNGTWHIEMGHGVVDAYQAVLAAQRLASIADLYVKDASYDTGLEPNATPGSITSSPDIWVTDLNGNPVSTLTNGETYQVHVKVRNRTGNPFAGSADNTLLLRWKAASTVPDWKNGWTTGSGCGVADHGIVMQQPLGNIPPYGSAVYTTTWTAPSFPGNSNCMAPTNLNLYLAAIVNDEGITVNSNARNYGMDEFIRQNNNVAMRQFNLANLDVYIEPLIPILGAPVTLTGGSSEPDAELTWRRADGTVLGTGETLDITPSATAERYVLEGYSPSLGVSASDTLTLHPRLGAILAVSPNPVAGGQTEVSCRLATTLASATLQIIAPSGTQLLSQPLTPAADGTATAVLNLQGIPTGHYQLRLMTGTALVDAQTLVVQ